MRNIPLALDFRGETIVWLTDDGEEGLEVGCVVDGNDAEAAEIIAANAAARSFAENPDKTSRYEPFRFESEKKARQALTAAKRAVAEYRGAKPWPEWAKQASAAGWKPPRGWTP